jgi:hypothetical protein
MPTLTMAANDPLPFAAGGSGLGGSLQLNNQPPTFAIR